MVLNTLFKYQQIKYPESPKERIYQCALKTISFITSDYGAVSLPFFLV